jgi:Trypsin-like peptidase domain
VRYGDRINSAVRIWNSKRDQPIGGGFLVDNQHIMTCAHVVDQATGEQFELKARDIVPKTLSVAFDFVSTQNEYSRQLYTASVVPEGWRPEKGTLYPRDVAVLRLDQGTTLLKDAVPVVACNEIVWGDKFQAYGIKDGLADGTYVLGELVGPIPPDRVEVYSERVDQAIAPGCSGAGVWNTTRFGLAGMIVEMYSERQGRIIPIEQLKTVWNFVQQSADPQRQLSNASVAPDASLIGRRLSSLLHTFDRELQEADFDRAIETLWTQQQRPIVCAISGLADDRPLLCRDRCVRLPLRHRLDRLKLSGRPPTVRHLRWPGSNIPDSLSRLKQQVKWVLRAPAATPESVRKAYNDAVTPFVFFTKIAYSEFDEIDGSILLEWINFWEDVGSEPINKPLAVFLIFELSHESDSRCILSQYFEDTFVTSSPPSAVILPRLNSFERDSVIDWLRQTADELALPDDDVSLRLLPSAKTSLAAQDLRLSLLESWIDNLRI